MKSWDKNTISEQYRLQAEEAERYLNEIKLKAGDDPSYKLISDEHLARFYVFYYLHGRTFLKTKELLLSELQQMLNADVHIPRECSDKEQYKRSYRAYVAQEIEKLKKS